MNLGEISGFRVTIESIIRHFEKNGIESSLSNLEDYAELLNCLLDAEFLNVTYSKNGHQYTVDFKHENISMLNKTFYFIFGNENDPDVNSVLIDFSNDSTASLMLAIDTTKHLPLFKSIQEFEINYKEGQYSEIMNAEEFSNLLSHNSEPGQLTIIEVD